MLNVPATESSAVELPPGAVGEAIAAEAATVRSHLEYVLDEHAGPLSPEQRRLLEAAWRHARHLLRTAEDCRDSALAEAGSLAFTRRECDLERIVASAVQGVWPVAFVGRKTFDVRTEGTPRPAGDPVLMGRAVSALLEHAVEQAAPGAEISLSLDETGIQLSFQTDAVPPEHPIGLGLASAIARLHGGGLAVSVADGRTSLVLRFVASGYTQAA